MRSARNVRTIASIAFSLFLLAGLPAVALAGGSVAGPGTSVPEISGTVTALVGGAPLAGIEVNVIGSKIGNQIGANGTAVTLADGTYTLQVNGDDSYTVQFRDPTPNYLYGSYDTDWIGNLLIGGSDFTGVYVGASHVSGIDVQMTVGYRITGTVTGPATPPNHLLGIPVQADSADYTTYGTTLADGTFTLAVPSSDFRFDFGIGQEFYVQGCWLDGGMVTAPNDSCNSALHVDSSDVSGINARLDFAADVTIAVTPDGSTVAAGDSQTFAATLSGGIKNSVIPAKKGPPTISPVTAYVTFSMTGGTCSGAVCTPSVAGDHTVTATYGAKTGTAVLTSDPGNYPTSAPTSAPPAAPTAGPTAGPTPPPTSTGDSGDTGSEGGLLFTMLLFGMAAVAAVSFLLRRRSMLGR